MIVTEKWTGIKTLICVSQQRILKRQEIKIRTNLRVMKYWIISSSESDHDIVCKWEVSDMFQLSERARERKVPATQISRLANFGGEWLNKTLFFLWVFCFSTDRVLFWFALYFTLIKDQFRLKCCLKLIWEGFSRDLKNSDFIMSCFFLLVALHGVYGLRNELFFLNWLHPTVLLKREILFSLIRDVQA